MEDIEKVGRNPYLYALSRLMGVLPPSLCRGFTNLARPKIFPRFNILYKNCKDHRRDGSLQMHFFKAKIKKSVSLAL